MLQLKEIGKSYGKKQVLRGINLSVESGNYILLTGANGCGKTTLLKIITGFITSYTGEKTERENLKISSVIETPQFFESWTGYENLYYFLGRSPDESTRGLLSRLNIIGDCDRAVKKFSLGMKQKLMLVLALERPADLYVLDEPFNGLDGKSCDELQNIFREKVGGGKSIILSSHALRDVKYFDGIYRMSGGVLQKADAAEKIAKLRFTFCTEQDKALAVSALNGAAFYDADGLTLIVETETDEIPRLIRFMSDFNLTSAAEEPFYSEAENVKS